MQRRATKLVPGFRGLTYKERLKRLDMFSLKDRRIRGDLVETYIILNYIDNVNVDIFFELTSQLTTRNNGLKLKGQRFNTDLRKNYFNVRVINFWNKLPATVVQANTMATFKARLDKYVRENGF